MRGAETRLDPQSSGRPVERRQPNTRKHAGRLSAFALAMVNCEFLQTRAYQRAHRPRPGPSLPRAASAIPACNGSPSFQPLLNFEWVDLVGYLAAARGQGRAKRTLDAVRRLTRRWLEVECGMLTHSTSRHGAIDARQTVRSSAGCCTSVVRRRRRVQRVDQGPERAHRLRPGQQLRRRGRQRGAPGARHGPRPTGT